jgi:hypothetical protein
LNKYIEVKSVTNGVTVWQSKESGILYTWREYGAKEYITPDDIHTMFTLDNAFLQTPFLIINDKDTVEQYKLEELYKSIARQSEFIKEAQGKRFHYTELPFMVTGTLLVRQLQDIIMKWQVSNARQCKIVGTESSIYKLNDIGEVKGLSEGNRMSFQGMTVELTHDPINYEPSTLYIINEDIAFEFDRIAVLPEIELGVYNII